VNNIFQKTSAHWAKYSGYEYRRGDDGNLYILPATTAKPSVYDPLESAELMVIDALNVGRLAMKQVDENQLMDSVMGFVAKYGLLGFMTALPTTPDFFDYDAVYLPKNHFIKEETMTTQDYIALYFPLNKLDYFKDEKTMEWHIRGDVNGDKDVLALAAAFGNEPIAMNMSLQRDYAERFDWLVTQFNDLAFTLVSSFLYYEDYDKLDETTRDIYRRGVSAFGGIAPTYHISLYRDKPTIVWDFHSLLRGIQMMFSFALTDESKPLRLCKHCNMVFAAKHPNVAFFFFFCKNQDNVYRGRVKKYQVSV
jgi:hypothetical protein